MDGTLFLPGAVVQHGGWDPCLVAQVNIDAMPVVRSNALSRPIEGEALFVASEYNLLELAPAHRNAGRLASGEERVHLDPTSRLEHQAETFRLVAKVFTQILTDSDPASFVHVQRLL